MRILSVILFFFLLIACKQKEVALTAHQIVDNAIEKAGGENYEQAEIDFAFRDYYYKSKRNGDSYSLERVRIDENGATHDIVDNAGFKRLLEFEEVAVPDSMATKYANSVNSVHYFAQLPYGLNAPAVKKELLGEDTIDGIEYYEVGVSFEEEGGGTDFDDTFVYWIHKTNFTVDYLAYAYAVDGGGIRFREAYNLRVVEGIRFVDYLNYKPDSLEVELSDLDELHTQGKLTLLSKIENKDIKVTLTPPN